MDDPKHHERAAVDAAPLDAGADPDPTSASPEAALILVVDDDIPSSTALRDYLGAHGFRVAVAHDGIDALRVAFALHPSAILLDIVLPELSGFDVLRAIRAHPLAGIAATPIVAVTALAMAGDRERILAAGADDYVTKPVSLHQLLAVVKAHAALRPPA